MTDLRFLQIHTLHSYPAALLNRDDSGLAKRMSFGGTTRTRISSQCLKRHWRTADGEFALASIDGAADAIRSRNVVGRMVMQVIRDENQFAIDVLDAVEEAFTKGVYGDNAKSGDEPSEQSTRQPLLLGQPEIEYLQLKAREICATNTGNAEDAGSAASLLFTPVGRNEERDNFAAFRKQTILPGGLTGAMFGRMVTSDPGANIDAAIHVAHGFTVHQEESESDYFTVVDDLQRDDEDGGAAHIGDTELTAGLFYGYVVVDVPELVLNLSGSRELAGDVVQRLIHLIATVSPGAKRGSTAPYAAADLVLLEAGNRQPRSLANAFRKPVKAQVDDATSSLSLYLRKMDWCYGENEARRVMSVEECDMPCAKWLNCDALAEWASAAVHFGETN